MFVQFVGIFCLLVRRKKASLKILINYLVIMYFMNFAYAAGVLLEKNKRVLIVKRKLISKKCFAIRKHTMFCTFKMFLHVDITILLFPLDGKSHMFYMADC